MPAFLWALCTLAGPLFAVAILLSGCSSCQSTIVQTKMPVLAAGSFDGVVLDPATNRLYLADRADQGVDVVNVGPAAGPRFLTTVPLGGYPNGLAFAGDRHRLYAGMTGGQVAVIDADPASRTFMTVVDRVNADPTVVDLVDYSSAAGRVFAATARGGTVIAIDPATDRITDRYTLGRPLEQPRYDPADRMLYVSSPSTDTLLQVDPVSGRVVGRYAVPKCDASGLAISPAHQVALVACSSSIAVFDLTTDHYTISRDVQGGDVITYEAQADRFVVASPHGNSDSALAIFGGDGTFLGSVPATPQAHSAVFDAASGVVYAPGLTGLMSFQPAACAPTPYWTTTLIHLSIYAAPIAVAALVLFLYARSRDGNRERPKRTPKWRQRLEDLAEERERMYALEAAILDPPPEHPNAAG